MAQLASLPLKGVDIASGTTITPPGTHDRFDVTGTTTITTVATAGRGVGARFLLRFTGILTLTHHSSNLILKSGASATTAAGDVYEFEVIGTDQVRQVAVKADMTGYATSSSVTAAIAAAINDLLDGAPGALNTLNELAAALNDDASFAASMTTALSGKQPLDSDLTAIAALTTTSFGRALLELANAAALRSAAGLGGAALLNVGTTAGTVAAGDDARFGSGGSGHSEYALTDGGTITADWENGDTQYVTLGGNRTFAFSNPASGGRYVLILTQDGAGGRAVTWPTVKWAGGEAPTLSADPGAIDVITLLYVNSVYYGNWSLDYA